VVTVVHCHNRLGANVPGGDRARSTARSARGEFGTGGKDDGRRSNHYSRRYQLEKLSFYEQAGIVVPGGVLLLGVVLQVSALHSLLAPDGMTVGGLGLFVLVAYAGGHLVAAGGNAIEFVNWQLFGKPVG